MQAQAKVTEEHTPAAVANPGGQEQQSEEEQTVELGRGLDGFAAGYDTSQSMLLCSSSPPPNTASSPSKITPAAKGSLAEPATPLMAHIEDEPVGSFGLVDPLLQPQQQQQQQNINTPIMGEEEAVGQAQIDTWSVAASTSGKRSNLGAERDNDDDDDDVDDDIWFDPDAGIRIGVSKDVEARGGKQEQETSLEDSFGFRSTLKRLKATKRGFSSGSVDGSGSGGDSPPVSCPSADASLGANDDDDAAAAAPAAASNTMLKRPHQEDHILELSTSLQHKRQRTASHDDSNRDPDPEALPRLHLNDPSESTDGDERAATSSSSSSRGSSSSSIIIKSRDASEQPYSQWTISATDLDRLAGTAVWVATAASALSRPSSSSPSSSRVKVQAGPRASSSIDDIDHDNYLSDATITPVLEMLAAVNPGVYTIDSLCQGTQSAYVNTKPTAAINSLRVQIKTQSQLLSVSREDEKPGLVVLMPIHYSAEKHWAMAVLEHSGRKIRYFDSCPSATRCETLGRAMATGLAQLLFDEPQQEREGGAQVAPGHVANGADHGGSGSGDGSGGRSWAWEVVQPDDGAIRQTNGVDCGVAIIAMAVKYMLGRYSETATITNTTLSQQYKHNNKPAPVLDRDLHGPHWRAVLLALFDGLRRSGAVAVPPGAQVGNEGKKKEEDQSDSSLQGLDWTLVVGHLFGTEAVSWRRMVTPEQVAANATTTSTSTSTSTLLSFDDSDGLIRRHIQHLVSMLDSETRDCTQRLERLGKIIAWVRTASRIISRAFSQPAAALASQQSALDRLRNQESAVRAMVEGARAAVAVTPAEQTLFGPRAIEARALIQSGLDIATAELAATRMLRHRLMRRLQVAEGPARSVADGFTAVHSGDLLPVGDAPWAIPLLDELHRRVEACHHKVARNKKKRAALQQAWEN